MSELIEVWVVEHGDYENACTEGAWSSLEKAVESVKWDYRLPYVVRWDELKVGEPGSYADATLTGHFEGVPGWALGNTTEWYFWRMTVDVSLVETPKEAK